MCHSLHSVLFLNVVGVIVLPSEAKEIHLVFLYEQGVYKKV